MLNAYNLQVGRSAEDFTERYLRLCGFAILARNHRIGNIGEIDILAERDDIVYSVEVKGRSAADQFAGIEGLVSRKKLHRIISVTSGLLDSTLKNKQNCKIILAFVHLAENIHHTRIVFKTLK